MKLTCSHHTPSFAARGKTSLGTALLCAGLALSAGCAESSEPHTGLPASTDEALQNYAAVAEATYADTLISAQALDTAIDAFLAAPSEAGLLAAQNAWRAAREPYLQTEVFRFYGGPIDDAETGPEGMLNAWPLDEAYIDYVEGDTDAGIINDLSVTIDAESLMELNEQGGEENIATGYHAIEFLLWGQDHSDDGPGARPYTDFVDGMATNADRRRLYLATVSDLLVTHLAQVSDAWTAGEQNYRAAFLAESAETGLRNVLTGMIILSGFETGGERLQTALDSGDQEDEHSCFSDNTHRDMIQDVRGIKNVWTGEYRTIDNQVVTGTGIAAVIEAEDPELAAALDAKIDESLALAESLMPPFDQEIAAGNSEGRTRVKALVTALGEQEKLLEEVFLHFGLTIPAPE